MLYNKFVFIVCVKENIDSNFLLYHTHFFTTLCMFICACTDNHKSKRVKKSIDVEDIKTEAPKDRTYQCPIANCHRHTTPFTKKKFRDRHVSMYHAALTNATMSPEKNRKNRCDTCGTLHRKMDNAKNCCQSLHKNRDSKRKYTPSSSSAEVGASVEVGETVHAAARTREVQSADSTPITPGLTSAARQSTPVSLSASPLNSPQSPSAKLSNAAAAFARAGNAAAALEQAKLLKSNMMLAKSPNLSTVGNTNSSTHSDSQTAPSIVGSTTSDSQKSKKP